MSFHFPAVLGLLMFLLGATPTPQAPTPQALSSASAPDSPAALAHFHHLHLNATDPGAAIAFYTSRFAAERAKFAGSQDAVWTQKSWLLFNKVNQPPPSEILSALYHFGWGGVDMKAEYQRQLSLGTVFSTPITDISETTGRGAPGRFYYSYVDGPDHTMIEINTAATANFGHIHMLSADPIATAEWYVKEFGMTRRGAAAPPPNPPYVFHGVQLSPSASLMMDNVNFIFFPIEFAQTLMTKEWAGRKSFESPEGRVMDHFAFSVDNLALTLDRLRKDGVTVLSEAKSTMGGKMKSAFVAGPDNVKIEVVEGHAAKP